MPRRSAAVTIAIPVDADFPTLMRIPFRLVAILLASLVAVHASAADVADTFTPADNFDLADLYPTPAAWDADAQKLESQFAALAACKGHLGDGVARFRDCIDLRYALHKRYNRLAVYSGEALAADTSVAEAIARDQRADLLGSALGEADAFFDPEVLALGKARIDGYLAADTALAIYRFPLDEVLRRAPHTLDAEGESLVAAFGAMSDTGRNAYSIFTNAEMPWPAIRLAGGGDAKVDQVGYETLRESPVRDDRKHAMDAFFGAYKGFERSFGVLLSGQARQAMAFAKARRYADSITATLDERGIPVAVVDTLIAETDANLATLHRYFRLRARMLGVSEMHCYDIYPPLVKGDYRYTLPQAKALVLDAVAPLGPDYVEAMRRGFASRWMDAPPRPHKETGAHMAGAAYDVHPYVLMSFTGNYESLTTIAHEWGHAMHTSLAAGAQPFATSRYAIFVAEIASTFNEALLLDRMLKAAKSDDERLFYLGSALENLRGTFLPPGDVRRVRARVPRQGRSRRAGDGREPQQGVLRHPEALPRRRRRRRAHRRRRLRRMGVHPAFLRRVLRLPVRDVGGGELAVRRARAREPAGRARPLPRDVACRRLRQPLRARQECRRRPRHAGAVSRAGRAHERDHGPDGGDPREALKCRGTRARMDLLPLRRGARFARGMRRAP